MMHKKSEVPAKRMAGNAGAFYPATCNAIEGMIRQFNETLEAAVSDRSILQRASRAIIAPHAGYIYSGFTANIAHRILGNARPERVVVIGPSHHVYFEGISIAMQETYETPCGDRRIDTVLSRKLVEDYGLIFTPQAHSLEHSTETQIPFVAHYAPQAKIVELIYGQVDYRRLIPIIETVLNDPKNAVAISSDLSHFYPLSEAEKRDAVCLEGIAQLDMAVLDQGCEACGILGIKAMIEAARSPGWHSTLLDYRTSADASGDTQRVVGYASAVFG